MVEIAIGAGVCFAIGVLVCHYTYKNMESRFFGEKTLVLSKVVAFENQLKAFVGQIKNLNDIINSNIQTVGNCNVKVSKLREEHDEAVKVLGIATKEIQKEISYVQDHHFALRDGLSDLREVVSKKRAAPKPIVVELKAEDLSNALFPTKITHVPPTQKEFGSAIKQRVKDLKLDKKAKDL